MTARSRKNAVWICNEDTLAQTDAGASTYQGIYAASAAGERFARIKGGPVIVAERSPALGTVGDIVLA